MNVQSLVAGFLDLYFSQSKFTINFNFYWLSSTGFSCLYCLINESRKRGDNLTKLLFVNSDVIQLKHKHKTLQVFLEMQLRTYKFNLDNSTQIWDLGTIQYLSYIQ